ncbi:helix-turn-helix domain-containing protein [Sphingomonas sp. OK281]|uniref:helix-turn-helix domain-containing protein n=1 Tax=Sphingomonas sp. OK281 TaxID=1881067 RepID=UPI0008E4F373|nr:helix-turn-helix domain-containing protein [Sphingomonas sp. OK281]SFO02426.1 DNA binding domain-containing protein, excisionase family [Sphingomonas sp. OK281]
MENRIACSVRDAAEAIGVCPNTIYKHMREGRLEFTKLGTRRLIKVASLHRLIDPQAMAA